MRFWVVLARDEGDPFCPMYFVYTFESVAIELANQLVERGYWEARVETDFDPSSPPVYFN